MTAVREKLKPEWEACPACKYNQFTTKFVYKDVGNEIFIQKRAMVCKKCRAVIILD